jgi:hypothetical protein
MKRLKRGGYYEKEAYYKTGDGLKPLRICAVRKEKKSEEAGERWLKKENQRKRGGMEASEKQREYNKYILAATSLGTEVSAEHGYWNCTV